MAEILKGAPVAAALTEKLIEQADGLKAKGITPTLAILRVGENPGDISYETGAVKRCEKIGIDVKKFILPDVSKVLDTIENINADKNIHGCLMLRPLADKNIEKAACEILCPEKDVDCMTEKSLAKIFTGSPGFAPCTAQACMELLDFYGVELEGKSVAVIGRSLVIGKPVSMLLQNKNATVTMCHSRTKNLAEVCRNSEIIIAAIGKANFIDKNFAAPGQIIIDVGINLDSDGKLCGDVNFNEAEPIVKAITPVPAGVGAVTTAVLAKHVIEAALVMVK
ncbi:MAG: bifunctional 5,10-methylene-tetrahydrofolate dehydrogenase/5,10-methylene-tetrahydrofolate cyclohydrolase [Synergistaceae bacterium]|nr:bifunctional 5,10-methylene-tetrahydrofolate dehydrogenase/5,10-methylene-tetrahydrofolate cyclohydrolase [Synergistaceae bacterium]